MRERSGALFRIPTRYVIEGVSGRKLIHSVGKIVALDFIGGRIVMILEELYAISEKDFLEPAHCIVGVCKVVACNAVHEHAEQSTVVIITGIIDGNRIQPGDNLLLLCDAAGIIVRAVDIGNNVLPPAACSIFGFDEVAGGIVVEVTPIRIPAAVVPIAPPVTDVPVAYAR